MKKIAFINPMRSRAPTGIGIAADEIWKLLPLDLRLESARLNRWFAAINDGPMPRAARGILRIALAQVASFFFPRQCRLLFATHHAPLWRTGRHALVVYDTIPLQFPDQAPAQTRYFRRWLPRALRCASRVIAISASVREELEAQKFPGASEAVVLPSHSPSLEPRAGAPVVERRAARELLVVGARYPHKNIDVVLGALEQINARQSAPLRLVIAGCRREIWARAWGGLVWFEKQGWVRVIDRVDAGELSALYARATALVYPSLAEGQGLPPLEAMAHGCPVICSELPVLRETCGDAAFYFSPTDGANLARLIEELLSGRSDEALARQQAHASARLALFGADALRARWSAFLEAWP